MPLWVWGPACTSLPSCTHSRPHSFLERRRARPARQCRMWELVRTLGVITPWVDYVAPRQRLIYYVKILLQIRQAGELLIFFCYSSNMYWCVLSHQNRIGCIWLIIIDYDDPDIYINECEEYLQRGYNQYKHFWGQGNIIIYTHMTRNISIRHKIIVAPWMWMALINITPMDGSV